MSNQQFGERLHQLRKKKGITQLKIAFDLHFTQNSISQFENGKRHPDSKTLISFADYFDVSIDYLLQRTDNPHLNK